MSTSTVDIQSLAILAVRVDENAVTFELSDGRSISAPLAWYPRLLHGTAAERSDWRLIGAGNGVHWPKVDEDVSLENVLAGKPSGESQTSLKKWLEQRV